MPEPAAQLQAIEPTTEATILRVHQLSKTYGRGPDANEAIRDVSVEIRDGEVVCLVGPSGAGKTTLLRCLAGLLAPTAGSVEFEGRNYSEPPPHLAVVFQDYSRSLMPWLSVEKNVTLPLRGKGIPRAEQHVRAREMLAAVGLNGVEQAYPTQLSGGMQQRVAIARALAYQPRLLLMDEPFASLDAQTRADLEDLTLAIRRRFDVTLVFVTHDIDEAVYLGDRVVVLSSPPSVVSEIVDVPLPRPRDQIDTKSLPEFGELRGHVLGLVRHGREPTSSPGPRS